MDATLATYRAVRPGAKAGELLSALQSDWTAVAAPMSAARWNHTATLLASGKVLVAGGSIGPGASPTSLASTEVFDPGAGTWTAASPMTVARYLHTATLLPSGKVLAVGGRSTVSLRSAEFFDPGAGTWTAVTATMASPRINHSATLLPSGKVLVAGGGSVLPAERGGVVVCKPWKGSNGKPGLYGKRDFNINVRSGTVTCPPVRSRPSSPEPWSSSTRKPADPVECGRSARKRPQAGAGP